MAQLNIQPFQVRSVSPLSPLQMEWLLQLYQPLCGSDAIGTYLTLSRLADSGAHFGTIRIHEWLLNQLKQTVDQFQRVRRELEALGLMQTYQASDATQAPHVLYELLSPLDLQDFVQRSPLSSMLKQVIGDQAYYQLLKRYEVPTVDLSRYEEVTVALASVFSEEVLHSQDAKALEDSNHYQHVYYPTSFGDGERHLLSLLPLLKAEQIPLPSLTRPLQQLFAEFPELCQQYPQQVVNLVKLSFRQSTMVIDIKQLAEDFRKLKQNVQSESTSSAKNNSNGSASPRGASFDYQALINAANGLTNEAFLAVLKEDKNGFVTAQEEQNLKNLQAKSQLSAPVMNMLIYFILRILNKENVWQRELERYANEWQQANILTAEQAINWLQLRKQRMQKEQTEAYSSGKNTRTTYKNTPRRAPEPMPKWRQEQQQQQSEPVNVEEAEAVKARLHQLMRKED